MIYKLFFLSIFFVLRVIDYEIYKGAIIHMEFIKHFSKYYDLKKNYSSKQLTSSFYLSLKIRYECSQMYEHQLINDYNPKL
jgi:hypothetical protein